jgi:hypothetical protein
MKASTIPIVGAVALLAACSVQPETTVPPRADPGDAKARIIAAAGADRLSEVAEIRFTFRVERSGAKPVARHWTWRPAEQRVTRSTTGDDDETTTVSYARNAAPHDWSPDAREADRQFINDTFWLLPALHLAWAGPDVTVEDCGRVVFPIGAKEARLVLVRYPASGGGYTPGDTYSLFLDDRDRIVGWHFHRGGSQKPTLTTTFENHRRFEPLLIALEHRNHDGRFNLRFTDVVVMRR